MIIYKPTFALLPKDKKKTVVDKRARVPVLLLYAAIFYNAVLAFINAHGVTMTEAYVVIAEGLILLVAIGHIVGRLNQWKDQLPFIVVSLAVFVLLFLWVSVMNATIYIKSLRDIIIIFVFYLLGTQISAEQLIKTFKTIVMIVVGLMFVEGWMVDLYAAIFKPALYYANTRGVQQLSVDSSGLFRNSLGFQGRFTFGLFGMRRVSSVFLEQVSFANFAMVLAIFTAAFWQKIKHRDKFLFVVSIVFMIVANSSRTATAICAAMVVGYMLFPRLPRITSRLTMPVILAISFLFFFDASETIMTDDLKGRIGHTIAVLLSMNIKDLFAGNIAMVNNLGDSGYAYLIATQTVLGLIYFWCILIKLLPVKNDSQKRFVHGVMLYIACNLLIGEAIFSIKVSAPIWFIAGCIAAQYQLKETRYVTDTP